MTKAVGEVVLDFTGLANVSPYAPAGYTYLTTDKLKIESEQLRSATLNTTGILLYTAFDAGADIVRAEAEPSFGNVGNGATVVLGLLDSSYTGYRVSILGGTTMYLREVTNGAESGFLPITDFPWSPGDRLALEYQHSTGRLEVFKNDVSQSVSTNTVFQSNALQPAFGTKNTETTDGLLSVGLTGGIGMPTTRKGSTLTVDKPGTLGTVTTATLNAVNVFDHLTAQDATTATFAGAVTDEITTSGEYSLVLGDGTVTETITVQVNVYGVAPSNNPVQKDGAALASLTGVQLRVTSGANINGTELFYSGTATTDASGNLSNIDLSSTAAADADPVLLHMRTSAGDNIIASETVGLI